MWSLCWKIGQVPAAAKCTWGLLCSPLQHALVSCCLLSLYEYGISGQIQVCPSLLILADWNVTDAVCNTILHLCQFLYTKTNSGGRKLCSGTATHWHSKLGHLEVSIHSLFFFSSVKRTANNSLEGTKESKLSLCKYKNTYANYLYLAWKRTSLINSSVRLYWL